MFTHHIMPFCIIAGWSEPTLTGKVTLSVNQQQKV
jgi:hypothetical protein